MSRSIIIAAVAVILIIIVIAVLARAYLREDTGKHGENANNIRWQYEAKHASLAGRVIQIPQLSADDTEQLSVFDRADAAEANERLVAYYEAELTPAVSMVQIFAEVAQLDAALNTGVLAFPDWTDSEYPHNYSNYRCPGPGIKCLCWDIAIQQFDWERITA